MALNTADFHFKLKVIIMYVMAFQINSNRLVGSQVSFRELHQGHLLVVPGHGGQELLPGHPDLGVVGAEAHIVPRLRGLH